MFENDKAKSCVQIIPESKESNRKVVSINKNNLKKSIICSLSFILQFFKESFHVYNQRSGLHKSR